MTGAATESCDVLVLGAGVIGCGVAWRLAQAGLHVIVIERAETPGAEASTAAAGILAAQIEASGPGPFFDLACRSRALYPRWAEELRDETSLDIGYRRCGALLVVNGTGSRDNDPQIAAELLALQERAEWQTRAGLRVERLDRAAIAQAEPAIDGIAALLCPDEGQVEPERLVAALVQAMQRRGARLYRDTALRIELDPSGQRVVGAQLRDRRIAAAQVVVALGSWSSLLSGAGLPEESITPVRGQMIELGGQAGALRHVVFGHVAAPPPLASAHGGLRSGYLVPRPDGRVIIGSTMDRVGFCKELTAAGLLHLLHLGTTLSPTLAAAPVRRTWAGLRPASPDGLPLIGPTPIAGLSICTGHFRNGILLAPISAEAICGFVLGSWPEGVDPLLLAPLHPSRLGTKLT